MQYSVTLVLISSLFVGCFSSWVDRLVVHDIPDGAVRHDSSWLAHVNFPSRFYSDITKKMAEDKLTDVKHVLEAAGFPILKSLRDHMFRFDVSDGNVLSPAELRKRLTSLPLFQELMERLEVDFHVEANLRYYASVVQENPGWNLDRIDQLPKDLDNRYGHLEDGDNAHIYILDSGIRTSHEDFEGRAHFFWSALDGGADTGDCNGHGTHVAGIAASKTYGVAKKATVWSVKVLDCNGWGGTASILDAMDAVAAGHKMPAVLSMSLGGPRSYIMDLKATILTQNEGVLIVVAAGNDNINACSQSPARNGGVITVGASTSSDTRASYSNWGKCLDLFAPGHNIKSLSHQNDYGTAIYSGTSMAAPLVSGVAALWLDHNPHMTPADMFTALLVNSTMDALRGIGDGSPNRLLYQPFNEGYNYIPPDESFFHLLGDRWVIMVAAVVVLAMCLCGYYAKRHRSPNRGETLLVGGAGVSGSIPVVFSDDEEGMVLSPMDLMPYDITPGTVPADYVPPAPKSERVVDKQNKKPVRSS